MVGMDIQIRTIGTGKWIENFKLNIFLGCYKFFNETRDC